MRLIACAVMALVCMASLAASSEAGALSPEDRAAVIAATQAYSRAWLASQPDAVMATLAADAVLLPSGMEPIVGHEEIRKFWWPAEGPVTTVTAMTQVVDDIGGEGDIAVVRGHGTLSFTWKTDEGDQHRSQRSTFLNVLRRQANGAWLITQRMWTDLK